MSYLIKWDGNNPIVTFNGDCSTREMIDVNNLILGNERFNKMIFQICDFRDVQKFKLMSSHVKIMATLDRCSINWKADMKIALVATDPVHIALCRQYIQLMDKTSWRARHFKTMDEAHNWCKKSTVKINETTV